MNFLKKFFFILTVKEKKKLIFLLLITILNALLDTIGVASILPFMTIISNPDIIETNNILKYIYTYSNVFGVHDYKKFVIFFGFLIFIFFSISMMFKIFANFVQINFVQMSEYNLGKRLMERYLEQPYSWFLFQNSADLGKNILSEIRQLTSDLIRPVIFLTANFFVLTFILILLIAVDPNTSFSLIFVFCFFYLSIYFFINKKLSSIGEKRLQNNQLRFLIVDEIFSSIKSIKLRGAEEKYIKDFSNYAKIFAKSHAYSQTISILPRYILEVIIFGSILLITIYSFIQDGAISPIIPLLSMYVFAGYRLLPAIHLIYASKVQIDFISSALDNLYNSMKNLKKYEKKKDQDFLTFEKNICLKNISFNYPDTDKTLFNNLNLKIVANSKVGIVGTTGSGKTTLVDIILGLLEAQMGNLEVDGKIITSKNLRSWQSYVGYVPQNIYLSDNTIANNIAYGVENKNINYDKIREVAKIANIDSFIFNNLPKKYDTLVGEQGVRISGGQRQRIAIARALYHDPKILICDEATSALDYETEKAINDALNNLKNQITLIIVAHRINALKNCDVIYEVDDGNIKEVTDKLLLS